MTETTLAVIVAHGSPSDPDPLDRELRELAKRVGDLAPGLRVVGATLAKPGSLEVALEDSEAASATLVYPFFMSKGWFVSKELRRRVSAATKAEVHYLEPFGLDDEVTSLCIQRVSQAAAQLGQTLRTTVLVLAAHGSQRGPASANAARAIKDRIAAAAEFQDMRLGFVEEEPTIAEAATDLNAATAVCLPLFATSAGHVLEDIPEQLAQAGFKGRLMAPIGEDEQVPRIIANALRGSHQSAVS